MKIKLILLLTVFLVLSSCWSPDYVEDARVGLDLGNQQLIPYQKDQKINFIHSKGYAFDFTVTQSDLRWIGRNMEQGGCFPSPSLPKTIHYTTYQEKWVTLSSEYPYFRILLRMTSNPQYASLFNISINSFSTNINFDKSYKFIPDTSGSSIVHDSIVINGKTYNNVVEAKLNGDGNDFFESILYNELGLLQIKLSDDETFSINN